MKIDIETENNKHFLDISTFIDQPDFIAWTEKLRNKWKLTKRYTPSEFKEFYGYIWGQNDEESRWNSFLDDVRKVRNAFKKSPNFDDVIMYAIAFTQVPSYAYKSCYIKAESIDSSEEGNDEYTFSIIFSPDTTKDEILEEFSKFKNGLSGELSDEIKKDEWAQGYDWDVFPIKKIKDHIAGNIKRDREWYWLKENGLSYKQILEKAGIGNTERDSIVKAIKGYRKRLTKLTRLSIETLGV